jgi:hypothetical protein
MGTPHFKADKAESRAAPQAPGAPGYLPPGGMLPYGYGANPYAMYPGPYAPGYPPPGFAPVQSPAPGGSRLDSPAGPSPGRKRSYQDLRSSSPIIDDTIGVDEFCARYKIVLPSIVKGLHSIQFVPGTDISDISDTTWEKHGIQAGGVAQIKKANKRYKKEMKEM